MDDGFFWFEAEDDEPDVRCVRRARRPWPVALGARQPPLVRRPQDRRLSSIGPHRFTTGTARSTPTAPLVASAKAWLTNG
jgi:hypothetical protein